MGNVFYHIQILLNTQECVILPDFGAFILNKQEGVILHDGVIISPKTKISFNPELRQNDGLLTYHIANSKGLSYNRAAESLKAEISLLKKELTLHKGLKCGSLGKLYIGKEYVLLFSAESNYNSPQLYGFAPVSLSKLDELKLKNKKENKKTYIRHTVWTSAATVLAVGLFLSPYSSLGKVNNMQSASFIETIVKLSGTTNNSHSPTLEKIAEENTADTLDVLSISISKAESSKEAVSSKKEIDNNDALSEFKHHIVIGVDKNKQSAEKSLVQIRKRGYPFARIINSKNDCKIVVGSYTKERDAQYALAKIKNKHAEAWLYNE